MNPMLIRLAFITFLIGAAICVPLVVIGEVAGWSRGATGSAVIGGVVLAALIGDVIYDRELRKLERR